MHTLQTPCICQFCQIAANGLDGHTKALSQALHRYFALYAGNVQDIRLTKTLGHDSIPPAMTVFFFTRLSKGFAHLANFHAFLRRV
jgi:hypothetical protein